MNRYRCWIAAGLAALACAGWRVRPAEAANAMPQPELAQLAAGGNAFAFDLYAKLAAQEGNLFVSPFSIRTALAMTYAGAAGQTAEQMQKVLHFPGDGQGMHPAMARLIAELHASAKSGDEELFRLVVANALWAQEGYPFRKAFEDTVREQYGAALHHVDFVQAAEQARLRINGWVSDQTREKIKDLIPQGVLNPDTRLVLTNAIYFKSAWASQFQKRLTSEQPFHVAPGSTVRAPLMHQTEDFGYFENEQMQMVEVPYTGRRLSMLVLLPKRVDGLAGLEKSLDGGTLKRWSAGLQRRKVDLFLPKYTITSQFSLSRALAEMGMPAAFGGGADFSGISTAERLFIQAVLHKAFVDVNEEGTEAAAATAVMVGRLAFEPPVQPVVFRADHPFVFVIRHRDSDQILFLGRVLNPAG